MTETPERRALREVEGTLEALLSHVRKALSAPSAPTPVPPEGEPGLKAPAHALIVVDPGHGGHDPGAHVPDPRGGGGEVAEKDLVVPYAMALRGVLTDAGYDVALTRTDDIFIGLSQRAEIANERGALCLVSLHANAASAEAREGAWVIYDDATTAEKGQALAECIFTEMARVPGLVDSSPQRETFPDGSPWVGGRQLTVLSKARMPAVLVELSFMTNPEDLSMLLDAVSRSEIVAAIAAGIIAWHRDRIPSR